MEQGQASQPVELPSTHNKASFLGLPDAVRQRIYDAVDVVKDRRIYLLSAGRPPLPGIRVDTREVAQNAVTRSLLQACKTIHHEVMARVVTRNLLVVLPSELEVGLRFLDRLSPDHLRLITHLEIRLQERGRLLYDRCPAPAEIKRVKRAVLTDEKVSLWQEVAPRLLARLPPGKTTIRLFCDLEDKPDRNDTHYAAAIVQPFLDAPAGILAACGIRLGIAPSHDLTNLATEASCHATGDVHNPAVRRGIFRFSDLPREIRLNILEYTDLVTPLCDVSWHADAGFSVKLLPTYDAEDLDSLDDEPLRPKTPFSFCSNKGADTAAFCRAKHSAFHAECRCWVIPQRLMLVSRSMYEDAAAVFYSKNRIAIAGTGPGRHSRSIRDGKQVAPVEPRLDATRFLTMFSMPNTLQHIRKLEIAFPIFERRIAGRDFRAPDALSRDWQVALDQLAKHADLPTLSLTVHFGVLEKYVFQDSLGLPSTVRDLGYLGTVGEAAQDPPLPPPYCDLFVAPMAAKLKGQLRRFLVFLESEWHYSAACCCDSVIRPFEIIDFKAVCRNLQRKEAEIEKMVMGEEYDPQKKGEKMGQWMRCAQHTASFYSGGY
jgi:hypothetical protein